MKQLSKIKSIISIFLLIVFAVPTVVSCSNTEDIEFEEASKLAEYQKLEKKYEGIGRTVQLDVTKLKKIIQVKANEGIQKASLNGPTQADIDEYAVALGYAPGTVTLELFNTVLVEHQRLIDNGLENTLSNVVVDEFSRNTMLQIESTRSQIEDLNELDGYDQLSSNDQEQLVFMNSAVDGFSNEQPFAKAGGWDWDGYGAMMIGAGAGFALLGPVGLAVGAIVGLWIAGIGAVK
jgi:hypothetical protein